MAFYFRVLRALAALSLSIFSFNSYAQTLTPKTFAVFGYEGSFLTPDRPYTNGNYSLIFQSTDGNLVVYRGTSYTASNAVWSAGGGKGGKYAVLQTDGNFVIYKNLGDPNSAVWSSRTGTSTQSGERPYIGLMSDGSFGVRGWGTNNNRLVFNSPIDPKFVSGSCTVASQYPVCIFPGTTSQWSSFVLACSPAEAISVATSMGASYGACR